MPRVRCLIWVEDSQYSQIGDNMESGFGIMIKSHISVTQQSSQTLHNPEMPRGIFRNLYFLNGICSKQKIENQAAPVDLKMIYLNLGRADFRFCEETDCH